MFKVGDFVKVRAKGWEVKDIIGVVVKFHGQPSYPSPSMWTKGGYWIVSDGTQDWYYRSEEMEKIS